MSSERNWSSVNDFGIAFELNTLRRRRSGSALSASRVRGGHRHYSTVTDFARFRGLSTS